MKKKKEKEEEKGNREYCVLLIGKILVYERGEETRRGTE